MNTTIHHLIMKNTVFAWNALGTFVLLLIPLVAMQFTNEVNWDGTDFVAMGLLIFGTSSLFVLAARKLPPKYWFPIGAFLLFAFLYVWAELAVGIFTNLGS